MLFEGAILTLVPNLLLSLLNLQSTQEVWIRLVGVAFLVLGFYYTKSARANFTEFFGWTVQVRFVQFFIVTAIVIFTAANSVILLFSIIEIFSGIWTLLALKKQKNKTL